MTSSIVITMNQIRDTAPCKPMYKQGLRWSESVGLGPDDEFPVLRILETQSLDNTLWAMRRLPVPDGLSDLVVEIGTLAPADPRVQLALLVPDLRIALGDVVIAVCAVTPSYRPVITEMVRTFLS